MALTQAEIEQYERDGFVIVRGALDEVEVARAEQAFGRHKAELIPETLVHPAPGRYTLAKSSLADPDLGFVVEHPNIVEPARTLLRDDPILTAFVVYDRTPDGPGIPPHNDYKRWRPVGSSMNWLFTIVPLCDFDEERGQLFVAPGSHRLERVRDDGGRVLEITEAIRPDDAEFIDPELERGDLLIMNMHCWHKAAPNKSKQSRIGYFNKYAARAYPPATGYYLFDDAAYAALSDQGRQFMAVHSDKPLSTTRMLLQRGDRYLFLGGGDGGRRLPGGPTWHEHAIPDWDLGNYVAAVQGHLREQVKVETPWVTYVGDYEEGDGLCRVYAYELNDNGFPVPYPGEWLTLDEARERGSNGWEASAIEQWQAPGVVRGKALSQAQSRIDQYAY